MMAAVAAPVTSAALPRPLLWTCAAFGGGVLLHADRVPSWAAAIALLLILWRLLTAYRGGGYPGVTARALLALTLAAIVLARFHTLNGLAAGTTLLLLMAGLKLLETRAARDQFVMVAAGLFLLLAACLDRQELVRAPLYGLHAWLCCAALAVVAAPATSARAALGLAGRALLLAAPLALLLFVFFPRLPGAFWAIPRGELALSGLSDTMTPGSIGQLASSYDPAFRVQFLGPAPPPQERYWRGPVLHEFDGQSWRRTPGELRAHVPRQYLGLAYRYRVQLEPSRHRWWFALDTPTQSADARVLLTYDDLLVGAEPLTDPVNFEAVSYTHTRAVQPLDAVARRQDTALPRTGNPRARALAEALGKRAGSDAALVQAVLDYLRTGGFVYSLEPERLGPDAIDDFLFRTRVGFCGHYASAFVALMRAAGVPARVVTGYLGGEWVPYGVGYFLVRQSEAHAWAEVWLEGRGWTRVDPTAVVEPERLQRGILDLMPQELSARARLLHASPWLNELLQRWDAANAWWTNHVVRFDYDAQLGLLERLGIRSPDVRTLGWAFMVALCGWLAIIAWHVGRSMRPERQDALARAYARLCRKLLHIAPRAPHEGPLAFAAVLIARRPDLRAAVLPLLERYAELRYGPPAPATREQDLRAFRQAVARLSLPRSADTALTPT
jgi:transglutaminase-like putative cysteine protease